MHAARLRRPHRPDAGRQPRLGDRLQDRALRRLREDRQRRRPVHGRHQAAAARLPHRRAGRGGGHALYWFISRRGGFEQMRVSPTRRLTCSATSETLAAILDGRARRLLPRRPRRGGRVLRRLRQLPLLRLRPHLLARAATTSCRRRRDDAALRPWAHGWRATREGCRRDQRRAIGRRRSRARVRSARRWTRRCSSRPAPAPARPRALVDRYVALVLRRHGRSSASSRSPSPSKAAAELRDRVRHGLEARAGAETDEQRRQLIAAALAGLDRAQISTIHAFCQALLRTFAVTRRHRPRLRGAGRGRGASGASRSAGAPTSKAWATSRTRSRSRTACSTSG